MDELTALLRQARLEKQLSLKDISEITKIQPRYLEALENGDFSVFAGEVYLKGALKNFAATVGLDPAEVMALYNKLRSQEPEVEEVEQPVGEKVKTAAKPRRQKVEVTRQGPSFTAGVIVLLLFLVAAASWYGIKGTTEEPSGEPEPLQNGQIPGGSNAITGEPVVEPPPSPALELVSASGRETVYSVTGTEEIQVKLTFRELCWVQLKTDGTESFYPRSFKKGEELEATATDTVWIRLGNPPGAVITVNENVIEGMLEHTHPHNFVFVLEQ